MNGMKQISAPRKVYCAIGITSSPICSKAARPRLILEDHLVPMIGKEFPLTNMDIFFGRINLGSTFLHELKTCSLWNIA